MKSSCHPNESNGEGHGAEHSKSFDYKQTAQTCTQPKCTFADQRESQPPDSMHPQSNCNKWFISNEQFIFAAFVCYLDDIYLWYMLILQNNNHFSNIVRLLLSAHCTMQRTQYHSDFGSSLVHFAENIKMYRFDCCVKIARCLSYYYGCTLSVTWISFQLDDK